MGCGQGLGARVDAGCRVNPYPSFMDEAEAQQNPRGAHEPRPGGVGDADRSRSAELLKAKNAFEAETIAAALRGEGIEAMAVNTLAGTMLSYDIDMPRVIVPASQLEDARVALDRLQTEAGRIDWTQVEVGEAPALAPAPPTRWAWTIAFLLVPAGLLVLSLGTNRGDGMLQIIGGVVLFAAVVMCAAMMLTKDGGARTADADEPGRPPGRYK